MAHTPSSKKVIISGADALFGDLMVECVQSLRHVGYQGDIVILDFGFDKAQVTALEKAKASVRHIEVPDVYKKLIDSGG